MRRIWRMMTVGLAAVWLWCGCRSALPSFDGERAMADLRAQCEFGPRAPGHPGHDRCREFLIQRLGELADTVFTQEFVHLDSLRGQSVAMTNIIARFGAGGRRRLVCAHWDTRPVADHDPDPQRREEPILGANDGASGVAVLLELARLFAQVPPSEPVEMVLFDGEDFGPEGRLDLYLLGSRHFSRKVNPKDYEFAILLDMVGDADLRIGPEVYSARYAPDVVDRIWSAAEGIKAECFDRQARYSLIDDHIPLLEQGIPTVDLIDFDYPPWHTLEDTPDKCSAASLACVGRVVAAVLYSR